MDFEGLKLLMQGEISNKKFFKSNHPGFYSYTRFNNAPKILDGSCFFVNSIKNMNDENEAILHGDSSDRVFCLCFCNVEAESIPLWYLYGGIVGEGIRIGFTPSKMKDFICSIRYAYPVNNNTADMSVRYELGKDFELQYGWVVYKTSGNKVLYHGKEHYVYNTSDETFRNFYFIKNYEWNYENEFRIVFVFKEPPSEKIMVEFDKIKFLEKRGMNFMLAPNISVKENAIKVSAIELKVDESRVKTSKLKINFNLLKTNEDDIKKYFRIEEDKNEKA